MRLRYTGRAPVTLPLLGIEVEPGAVIELPDEAAARFATRPDFEDLDDPGPGGEKPSGEPESAQPETPAASKRKAKAAADPAEQYPADPAHAA